MEFNWINFLVSLLGAITFAVIFILQLRINRHIAKREIYQKIEFASIDLFRFENQNSDKCWRLYDDEYILPSENSKEYWEVLNHVTQILNLFEMTCEFRKEQIINDEIFCTWVPWFWDISQKRTLVKLWPDLKKNYSEELQKVIDTGIASSGKWNQYIESLNNIYHSKYIRNL
jgi:hypothetical protein